jgi:hypothetical protein
MARGCEVEAGRDQLGNPKLLLRLSFGVSRLHNPDN